VVFNKICIKNQLAPRTATWFFTVILKTTRKSKIWTRAWFSVQKNPRRTTSMLTLEASYIPSSIHKLITKWWAPIQNLEIHMARKCHIRSGKVFRKTQVVTRKIYLNKTGFSPSQNWTLSHQFHKLPLHSARVKLSQSFVRDTTEQSTHCVKTTKCERTCSKNFPKWR